MEKRLNSLGRILVLLKFSLIWNSRKMIIQDATFQPVDGFIVREFFRLNLDANLRTIQMIRINMEIGKRYILSGFVLIAQKSGQILLTDTELNAKLSLAKIQTLRAMT